MNAEDRPRFLEIMNSLAATFCREPTAALLDGYWSALADISIDALAYAAKQALTSSTFMPKPVELRRLTGELSGTDRASLAWRCVMRALEEHGIYRTIEFDDPIIHGAVRTVGGWERLGDLDAEQLERFESRKFADAYAALWRMDLHEGDDRVEPLVGLHDRNNQAKGYGVDDPIRIRTGLPVRALLPASNVMPLALKGVA